MIGKFLQGVGSVADLPGSMVRDAFALRNPLDQLATPWWQDSGNRTSGRDLLRHWGAVGNEDTWGNFAGGMVAEQMLDPLNLVGAGILGKYAKNLGAINKANKGIDAGNALSLQQRAMGFMPEEYIEKLHPSVVSDIPGPHGESFPKRFYHGTNAVFDQYDPKYDSGNNLYGKGFYHSDDPNLGSSYTGKEGSYSLDRDAAMSVIKKHELPDYLPDAGLSNSYLRRASQRIANGGRPEDVRLELIQAGVPRNQVDEAIAPSPMNVRMQYLDIRNPLDIEATYGPGGKQLPPRMADALIDKKRDRLRETVHRLRWLREKSADPAYRPNAIQRDYPEVIKEQEGLLRKDFATRHQPDPLTGEEIWRRMAQQHQEAVRSLGYDGITHRGGQVTGSTPHNVAIAFDPSQVYKPYIAKSLRERMAKPKAPVRSLGALSAVQLGGRGQ